MLHTATNIMRPRRVPQSVKSTKYYRSAMLQSWNKFCFTGGIMEAEIKLPGEAKVGGLWPAFWLLGNLARHTYTSSSNWIWPWSYDACEEKTRHAQKISACGAAHYGMPPGTGRGAPEIDVIEACPGKAKIDQSKVSHPYLST